MNETLITNGVTILIALMAGLIALHQVKLNILSSARIKWIEDLREILSFYSSEIENCSKAKLDFEDELQNNRSSESVREKYFQPYTISSNEVLKLQSKAFLYLNSKDPKQNEIEELMRKNSLLLHDMNQNHRDEIFENIQKIIRLAKEVFEVELVKSKSLFKM
ncbi:MAG: hypothetical protein ACK5PC_17030 [Cyclobacteriaceae bacterium]|jgi:hypothetical protein|nr:hypothetical protein [Flammeovirgaceae bacterium]